MIKRSAVIILHEQLTDSIILTKRTAALREHPGEFCFPGGGFESSDKTLWSTALRELDEELGIHHSRVTLIKELAPENTLWGKIIHPWLASIATIKPYKMNKQEVSGLLRLPMAMVKIQSNYKDIPLTRYGKKITSCQFTASEQFVWGATARIMMQLCEK